MKWNTNQTRLGRTSRNKLDEFLEIFQITQNFIQFGAVYHLKSRPSKKNRNLKGNFNPGIPIPHQLTEHCDQWGQEDGTGKIFIFVHFFPYLHTFASFWHPTINWMSLLS